MSKKNKRKWWQLGGFSSVSFDEDSKGTFSKTIAQHNQKLAKTRKFDEDGFELLEEDDLTYHDETAYNYNWDRKLITEKKIEQGGNIQEYRSQQSLNFSNQYNNYKSTGVWGGYSSYREPTLSYKYVQQMANALSARHKINVVVGNSWEVNLLHKKMTYNPASLIYGTKSELLATLMHEIGKLRYMTHNSKLKSKYIAIYNTPAIEVLTCFEDVRVDYQMLKQYEGATEIYESAMPAVEKQAIKYIDMAANFVNTFADALKKLLERTGRDTNEYLKNFGIRDVNEIQNKIEDILAESRTKGNIYHYCAEMLRAMYDLDNFGSISQNHPEIGKRVEATIDSIELSKKVEESQSLVNILEKDIYPIIEDLLKDFSGKKDEIKKYLPNISQETLDGIAQSMLNTIPDGGKVGSDSNKKGNSKVRNSGPSDNTTPPEWSKGDYKILKDSVMEEIRQLINRLTFIRREELTVKYQGDQRRGKLNSKKLYKSILGSNRIFKKKLENIDTIQSFAFSVLLDISGSMRGNRIIHSTRALIIFNEVFKKMDIPFELVVFGNNAEHIKKFDQNVDKDMEKKIAGLVNNLDGSTNLSYGLKALKLHTREEKNKIAIIITDGGVGNVQTFDTQFFIPWTKKGIKSVGIGIECEAQMSKLCMGNSKVLENANQMPIEFASIIKNLIKR